MPSVSPSMRRERRPRLVIAPAAADDDNTAWLITFSDLVLQLFAFVLVAVALGKPNHASATHPAVPPRDVDPTVVSGRLFELALPHPERADDPPAARRQADDLGDDTPAPEATPHPAVAHVMERLRAVTDAAGRPDGVTLSVRDADLIIALSDRITFPSGTADLLPGVLPVLAGIRSVVGSVPELTVSVEGHTDDVPIHTAEFPSNLELSLARAARVARELVASDPTLAARTSASGFGEHRPVAPNDDAWGRGRNRRVEIRLMPHEHPPT